MILFLGKKRCFYRKGLFPPRKALNNAEQSVEQSVELSTREYITPALDPEQAGGAGRQRKATRGQREATTVHRKSGG